MHSIADLSSDRRESIEQLLREGRKIEAIKVVRGELGVDLATAKRLVEEHADALGLGGSIGRAGCGTSAILALGAFGALLSYGAIHFG